MEIGETLRRLRDERGWTQYRLAKRAGLSPSYIHKLEAGKHPRPSSETVGKLARALGVPTSELTGEKEETLGPAGVLTRREREVEIVIRGILQDVVHLGAHIEDMPALMRMWASLSSSQAIVIADLIAAMYARSRLNESGEVKRAFGPPPRFDIEPGDINDVPRILGRMLFPVPEPEDENGGKEPPEPHRKEA